MYYIATKESCTVTQEATNVEKPFPPAAGHTPTLDLKKGEKLKD